MMFAEVKSIAGKSIQKGSLDFRMTEKTWASAHMYLVRLCLALASDNNFNIVEEDKTIDSNSTTK